MKTHKKNVLFLLCICLCLTALTACGGQEEEPVPDIPSATPSPTTLTPATPSPLPSATPESGFVNPLTGQMMPRDIASRRPAAVMLNNMKKALPMFGVSQADIIYELLAEGGITRLVGVYQDPLNVPQIGSVRSTRAYYLDVAEGHDAILLHAGGSYEATNLIKSRGMTTLDCLTGGWEGTLYWRDKDRIKNAGLEHSAFTSGERIEEAFSNLKSRTEHEPGYALPLVFADDGTPSLGEPAESVAVVFSSYKTGEFTYNPETKLYETAQYGKPFLDGQDDAQVMVTNIVILRTDVSVIKGDTAGRLQTRMTGTGNGIFICGGKSIPILWSKKSATDPFVYTLSDGTPLTLGKGKSYINIVPENCKVTIS